MRRVTAVIAAFVIAGCVATSPPDATPGTPSPSPSPAAVMSHLAMDPAASPSTPPPSAAAVAPTPAPSATAAAPAAASGSRPSAKTFWRAVSRAIDESAGSRLALAVRGTYAATLRFQPASSATVIDGEVLFLCRDGRAFDGQSGFSELDGRWTCGTEALIRGFRTMGQPVDAWSENLPLDAGVRETYDVLDDGTWRWRYRAANDTLGRGEIKVSVVIDPVSGRINAASRTDPLGKTTWKPTYDASFADLTLP